MTLRYRTKKDRLAAITNAYLAHSKKGTFRMVEVAVWATLNGLWPVPKRGDSVDECAAWEAALAKAERSDNDHA